MTITEVKGFGRQKGHKEIYRGAEYVVDFLPRSRSRVVVPTDMVQGCSRPSRKMPTRGRLGRQDFCGSRREAVRIRTGEEDEDAI